MLITEKIEKIKKNSVNFFKSLRQFSLKFNYRQAISKKLTILIKCESVKKLKKKKKNSVNFFKSLRPFPLKFNDPEPVSKQLTMLIKC